MKRRGRKQRMPIYGIMLFLVIFVISATGFCMWEEGTQGNGQVKESGHLPETKAGKPKTLQLETTESKPKENEGDASGQEQAVNNVPITIPDRSNFAVQPGVPVGANEPTDEKIVYLTIDDGPSKNTQLVLDILDKYNVKATFFVTNAQPDYREMIKKAYDKGHTIGLHTYTHEYQKVYASVDAYFQDLDAIGQAVKEQIGYVPCFIRFPGGSSNTVSANYCSGIMSALAPEVQKRGYQYYDWNVSSGDGSQRQMPEIRVLATSGTQNNIVLLCHDSDAKATTVEALPDIIQFYQNAGYQFKPLDRESYTAHHGISN